MEVKVVIKKSAQSEERKGISMKDDQTVGLSASDESDKGSCFQEFKRLV